MTHPSSLTGSTAQEETGSQSRQIKRERVLHFLEEHDLDGILLTLQSNFAWYSDGADIFINIATEDSIAELLITREVEHLFANTTEHPRLVHEQLCGSFGIGHLHDWWEDSSSALAIKGLSGLTIETDRGRLRKDFARLRFSLLPEEIERYRALGSETGSALFQLSSSVQPEISEYDLAAELSSLLLRNGIYPIVLLVAFDDRILRYRHPLPSSNRLKKIALVSVCGRRGGLVASASRMFSLDSPPQDLRRIHRAVTLVDGWLIQNTGPGVRVADIFSGLKEQYASAGFQHEWKLHHQGGATGYATRDYRATPELEELVQNNQAFAWNPTIKGTKSEDTIIVNVDGFQIITEDPRWPMLEIEVSKQFIKRPDILVV